MTMTRMKRSSDMCLLLCDSCFFDGSKIDHAAATLGIFVDCFLNSKERVVGFWF